MAKVSVIIIIYKVEKYLKECLKSVVSQTYENLEIICVVGKGDTGCEAIVSEYANKDSRIVPIVAEPKGTADARPYAEAQKKKKAGFWTRKVTIPKVKNSDTSLG